LVVSAVLAVVASVLFGVFVIKLFSSDGSTRLGDATFDVNAAFLARQVKEDGPVLFQDLLGGNRDIYVQHLGDTLNEGWYAVKATAPGQPRTCTLTWDGAARVFRDTRCGTGMTFPADGAGLEHYKAAVTGNKLIVDFRP
jgi:hypothetical protein